MNCIFGSRNQWASSRKVAPENFNKVAEYEVEFGVTIHRKLSVRELADAGVPYEMDPDMIRLAMADHYPEELIITPQELWRLPPGAFGESTGPT